MINILTIGHTGFLGSYLYNRFGTHAWPGRFEYNENWWSWAGRHSYDYIFYCARACRKNHPRRDKNTLLLEIEGIQKTLKAFPDSHIIYCSSKVVNGWASAWKRDISLEEIGDYFESVINGKFLNETTHLPEASDNHLNLSLKPSVLSEELLLYAQAKSISETLVKSCAKDYTIFRIWDIIP